MLRLKTTFERVTGWIALKTGRPEEFSFTGELAQNGWPLEYWLDRNSGRRCLYTDLEMENLPWLNDRFEVQVTRTLEDADRILAHTFDLLGSGPFTPVDSERPPKRFGYTPIDWYLDPVQNLRFPEGIPHAEWDLFAMRPGNADIKLPWELARCQHFATLGQAFRLMADDRYALEIVDQIDDFMEANPVGVGINWTCTMDVAIRAANWAIGLDLIKTCRAISAERWGELYSHLFDHGIFIFGNFENNYEVTSNHYLSNIVGLFFLSVVFEGLASANHWNAYCRRTIPEEISKQILPDGADFESSIPYHRLVLELFLGAARLAEIQGNKFSDTYYRILSKMAGFLFDVMRPDGLMPVVGDADDGRLHILTNYGQWNRQDGRHVLAPAAGMLDKSEWLACAGQDEMWEAVWWGYDPNKLAIDNKPHSGDTVSHYPQAGISVARFGGDYLLVSNSIVGTEGFGNHKHNDQLSFELHWDQFPLIVDPGSHVYTSDFDSRNLFRSTVYHNTLCIDGQEQNEFKPEWLFRMFEKANAEHISFKQHNGYVEYVGRHSGYRHQEEPVSHTRCFRFLIQQGLLLILDSLEGRGIHELVWHFHFGPGLELALENGNCIKANKGANDFFLAYPQGLEPELHGGWCSPSYGVKHKCGWVSLKINADIGQADTWLFVLGSSAENLPEDNWKMIKPHQIQMKRSLSENNENN